MFTFKVSIKLQPLERTFDYTTYDKLLNEKNSCLGLTVIQAMARRFEIQESFCGQLVDSVSDTMFRLKHEQLHPEVKAELMSRMEVDIVRLIRSQADCKPELQDLISEVVITFDILLQSELEQNHAYCSLLQDIRRRRGQRAPRAAAERGQ